MKYLNDVTTKNCVGKILKSLNSGDFKVLKYNDSKNVEIEFLKTGYRKVTKMQNVKSGSIKDQYSPSVFGVGVVGTKYPTWEGSASTKEHTLWRSMLERSYYDTLKKKNPTYVDCTTSENFLYYEYFYEWCQEQFGFGNQDWQLDKDLLIKGDKVYSENTCVFLPKEINSALTKSTATRGEHLIGVCWSKKGGAFVARVGKNKGKQEYLGSFKTEIEAFNAYKQAKENRLKELANKWKSQIDPRAYNALMNYEVNITD